MNPAYTLRPALQGRGLQVLHPNPARRLYERLGFVETGRTETHLQMRRAAS